MKCDGCTLCCKLIAVPWMNSPAGQYCHECKEGVGCSIFDRMPADCKGYQCLYNQMEKCSVNLRPDKCHAIFEKFDDTIITILLDNGKLINEDLNAQIGSFNKEGFSVFLSEFGKSEAKIYPAKGISGQDVFNKVMRR